MSLECWPDKCWAIIVCFVVGKLFMLYLTCIVTLYLILGLFNSPLYACDAIPNKLLSFFSNNYVIVCISKYDYKHIEK